MKLVTDDRRFPVQSEQVHSVPWLLVATHEAQAMANHGQSLERLAERGGLGPDELWCVVHNQPFRNRPNEAFCAAWLSGITDLRSAIVEAEYAQAASSGCTNSGCACNGQSGGCCR